MMNNLDMKPEEINYVIYHNACSDGFTAALFGFMKFNK